jgi:hypothetical protein
MSPVGNLSMSAIEAEAVRNCTARMAGKGGAAMSLLRVPASFRVVAAVPWARGQRLHWLPVK